MVATVQTPQFITDSTTPSNPPINLAAVSTFNIGPFADGSSGIEFLLINGGKAKWVTTAALQAATVTNLLAALTTLTALTPVAE